MNIIIPIGGVGRRYSDQNYTKPKPLVNFLGKPIIFWLLSKLSLNNKIQIHIPYNSILDNFNFQDSIKKEFPNLKIIFYKIDFLTRGAAETVYIALNSFSSKQLKDGVLIIDSDNVYLDDIVDKFNNCDDDCIFYFKDNDDYPIYSYIKIENNIVEKIAEKNKISSNANCGVYGFKSGLFLKKSIENVIRCNIKSKNEFYISNIYEYILNKKNSKKIVAIEINNFFSLGTPELLKINSFKFQKIQEKKIFCFDLDNTLVSYPLISGDYTTVQPLTKNISFCNFLKSMGNEIIIYTARRMKTHGGNIGKINRDVGKITLDTLEKFDIKYDQLFFGKPHADFYIDDLAINAFDDLQKQTGFYDLNIAPRKDNSIEFKENTVIKKSNNLGGLIYYHSNIPDELIKYFPKMIDHNDKFIELERVKGVTLSQIFVNNCFIKSYIDDMFKILSELHNITVKKNTNIYDNYYKKTKKRIETFSCNFYDENYEDICSEILSFLFKYEKENLAINGMIHGDLVFTNIILDDNGVFKLIDMRGQQGDVYSVFGDIFYDYAKIYQSIIGYDEILNQKFANKLYKQNIKKYFEEKFIEKFGNERLEILKLLTKSLLLSLLPIHNNENNEHFFKLIKTI
jgi:capsule biosynthesis phosphatase